MLENGGYKLLFIGELSPSGVQGNYVKPLAQLIGAKFQLVVHKTIKYVCVKPPTTGLSATLKLVC